MSLKLSPYDHLKAPHCCLEGCRTPYDNVEWHHVVPRSFDWWIERHHGEQAFKLSERYPCIPLCRVHHQVLHAAFFIMATVCDFTMMVYDEESGESIMDIINKYQLDKYMGLTDNHKERIADKFRRYIDYYHRRSKNPIDTRRYGNDYGKN